MKRVPQLLLLLGWLAALLWPANGRSMAAPPVQAVATSTPKLAEAQAILAKMSPQERVGQLFLVTFQGTDVSPTSDIAVLVRDYHVGGVVLLPANQNFRTTPVQIPVGAPTRPVTPTLTVTASVSSPAGLQLPDVELIESAAVTPTVRPTQTVTASQTTVLSTPQQIAALTAALQALVLLPPRPITATLAPTATITPTATLPASRAPLTPTASGLAIPLLIGVEWSGDDDGIFSGNGGFSPLPTALALGATWSQALAEQAGRVAGEELRAVGINLLLGPPLDVLDTPRPGNRGDLNTRAFGGDPYWVGQMGQAFLRGIQTGSRGSLAAIAKHFPGQGASDRRLEDEVATVQKSLQQLRLIELAPFAAVTASGDPTAPGAPAGLLTSHIRYQGLQGNIRQLTPPISLAPELNDLLALKEFADWRAAGGLLVSDALGVPALRRYYDPSLQRFPHRQVAQDAFLAGNDMLYLARFALTDEWAAQFAAIKETILFFQGKYATDREFRARVDAAAARIIALKLRLYGGTWQPQALQATPAPLDLRLGQDLAGTQAAARAGLTVIYPGRNELSDRLPSAPLLDENIVIFTEARELRDCATCPGRPAIPATALSDIMLRLYGPAATGKVAPNRIQSFTYADLYRALTNPASPTGQTREVENAIAAARWLIFAQLDYSPDEHPESAALRMFLARRSDSLRDKRLVVMAFQAPYYLDTTEISKLTAYFGVYGKTAPFLETAVRALFREFTPTGAAPVSIPGINYDLIKQLEPAPGQVIALGPIGPIVDSSGNVTGISVGSRVPLETGVILDRLGHPVPDGTLVEFRLRYPAEALDLAPKIETTVNGKARHTIIIDRPGELWVSVQAGEARESTRVVLRTGGAVPGSIATIVPSPTPAPTPTPTPLPTFTPSPEPSLAPTQTATPAPPSPSARSTLPVFVYALAGVVLSSLTALAWCRRPGAQANAQQVVAAVAWAVIAGWTVYLLLALGWLPGLDIWQTLGRGWLAGALTFGGGLASLLWSRWW